MIVDYVKYNKKLIMGNTCDYPAPLQNFNAPAYMGNWYGQQHVAGFNNQPDDYGCVQAIYSGLDTSNGKFTVANSIQDSKFGPRTGVTGTGQCPNSGQCKVAFYGSMPRSPNYLIVDTDYSSYSIVYSCGWFSNSLFLITREPVISQKLYDTMVSIAKAKLPNFDWSTMAPRDYQGPQCSYIQ